MKLLYITNGIHGAGGLERVLSIKASYLADNYGYQVTILSLNDAHLDPFYTFSSKINMISIKAIGNPINYSTSYIRGIKKVVKELNPNVISVCDDGLKAFFLPIILEKKFPIIYERHVSKLIEHNETHSNLKYVVTRFKWFLMSLLGNCFEQFVVLTDGNKSEWKGLNNLHVIPNPLSFYPENSSALENKKVIAVGKQGYQKGYDLLLPAWSIVLQTHQDWKLEIYGSFDENADLIKLSRILGINSSVFFKEPVKDIKKKYLEASIYVMSSRYEGFGMVLIEAMACGLPCVSFNCNHGPSDIIKDGEDGYLAEKLNINELASKLIYLIENRKKRLEMGTNAKENVKRYLPEVVVPIWDQLFIKLIK
jgi:glycosyltransferase involved in cell wall biosynthesis